MVGNHMCQKYIKFIRGQEANFLISKPFVFALLALIAERARRVNGLPDGLEIGECYVGDHKAFGASRKQYRTALEFLIMRKHVEKIETCRNRKKSATGTTTIGTKVKLISSTVWDINPEDDGHRKGHRGATEGPRRRMNKKEKEVDSSDPTDFFALDEETEVFILVAKKGGFVIEDERGRKDYPTIIKRKTVYAWKEKFGVEALKSVFKDQRDIFKEKPELREGIKNMEALIEKKLKEWSA